MLIQVYKKGKKSHVKIGLQMRAGATTLYYYAYFGFVKHQSRFKYALFSAYTELSVIIHLK